MTVLKKIADLVSACVDEMGEGNDDEKGRLEARLEVVRRVLCDGTGFTEERAAAEHWRFLGEEAQKEKAATAKIRAARDVLQAEVNKHVHLEARLRGVLCDKGEHEDLLDAAKHWRHLGGKASLAERAAARVKPPPAETHPPETVSTGKAARMLGVPQHKILAWADAGLFPGSFRQKNKHRRIPTKAVEAFVASGSLPEEKKDAPSFVKIRSAADFLGVTKMKLREMTDHGLVPGSYRDSDGHRCYPLDCLDQLKVWLGESAGRVIATPESLPQENAAARLKMEPQTLDNFVKGGHLPAPFVAPDGAQHFLLSDIVALERRLSAYAALLDKRGPLGLNDEELDVEPPLL